MLTTFDAQSLRHVAKRVLGNDAVFFLAQNEADTRLVVRVTKQIIPCGKIEVHLAGIFRLERTSQLHVVEEQVDSVFLARNFKRNLTATKRKSYSKLKEKLLDVADKADPYVSFVSILGEREEIEVVRVLKKLAGKIRLWLWKRCLKVGHHFPLPLMQAGLDMNFEEVLAPSALDRGLGVPKTLLRSFKMVNQADVVTPRQ